MTEKPLFSEKQRFTQPLIWLITGAMWVLTTYGFVLQVLLSTPWGNNPVPDWVVWLLWILSSTILSLFIAIRMEFQVFSDRFVYCFQPLHRRPRTIYFDDVYCWKVVKYSPLIDYGGWGLRFSFTEGYAFSVKGNWGVKIRLKNGHHMLIGSQKPEELRNVLHTLNDLHPCHDIHIR